MAQTTWIELIGGPYHGETYPCKERWVPNELSLPVDFSMKRAAKYIVRQSGVEADYVNPTTGRPD